MNACKVLELLSSDKIEELERLAKLEIKEQVIKEKGGNKELKRFKAAQKYIKRIEKRVEFKRLAGTWEECDKQCFTNGYTAFILKNKIEELPKTEQSVFNLHRVLNNTVAGNIINVDISNIKAAIKIHKATHNKNSPICLYDLGISCYNAEYIVNCYEILGGDIVFKQSETSELSPAILESENGIAILLPMRKKAEVCA